MKNWLLLVILVTFLSCEKDDFCLQNPVTPNLIIRFYDNENRQSLKEVRRLSVWATDKDTLVNYKSQDTDSIVIPLNTVTKQTVYNFKMNNTDGLLATNQTATFTINYDTTEEYVSRSCGFRVIFNNVTFTSSNNWILDFTPSSVTTINNQNNAHVQIFH